MADVAVRRRPLCYPMSMESAITRYALSVQQPFATLLVRGKKRHEVRSWPTKHRGRLYIHASSRLRADVVEAFTHDETLARVVKRAKLGVLSSLPRSAIVGAVDLKDVRMVKELSDVLFTTDHAALIGPVLDDDYLWEVIRPVEFPEPIHVHGRLGLWRPPARIEGFLDTAYRLATARKAKRRTT